MHTLSSDLPEGDRRGAAAAQTLADDYREFFRTQSGQRVLADLANASGFYTVCERDVSSDVLRVVEGERRLFNRILRFAKLTPGEYEALEKAARIERLTSNREGDI